MGSPVDLTKERTRRAVRLEHFKKETEVDLVRCGCGGTRFWIYKDTRTQCVECLSVEPIRIEYS